MREVDEPIRVGQPAAGFYFGIKLTLERCDNVVHPRRSFTSDDCRLERQLPKLSRPEFEAPATSKQIGGIIKCSRCEVKRARVPRLDRGLPGGILRCLSLLYALLRTSTQHGSDLRRVNAIDQIDVSASAIRN